MKKCRRMRIVVGLVTALALLLCGCQPTPEEDVVVNKAQGLPEGAKAAPVGKEEVRDFGAPNDWKEKIVMGEGKLEIHADTQVDLPKVANTPVWEMENQEFTQELLDQLTGYFAKGRKFYLEPGLTPAELELVKERLQAKDGTHGNQPSLYVNEYVGRAEELMKTAVDHPEKVYVKPEFTPYERSDLQYIMGGEELVRIIKDRKAFQAVIESDEDVRARISAVPYDKKAGSASRFTYRKGVCLDGQDLENEKNGNQFTLDYEGKTEYFNKYKAVLERAEAAMGNPGLTEEEARGRAEELLENLGIQGMTVEETYPALWYNENRVTDARDMAWIKDPKEAEAGYAFYFGRDIEGIAGAYPWKSSGGGTPELSYAPSFPPEIIQVVVTKSGIPCFSWENMAKLTKVVAENTNLLGFDEIKEKFGDHMYYATVAACEAHGDTSAHVVNVSGAKFRYTYITAYNQPDHVWLAPVWIFEAVDTYSYETADKIYHGMLEEVGISAIDGGYVDMSKMTVK